MLVWYTVVPVQIVYGSQRVTLTILSDFVSLV